jgi:UV-stimulated scaffold protein A
MRAKLARIRRHNEEVLRESAIASTSYSENLVQSRGEFKMKKPTLASMLKKKITAKDRIAKKLL